MRCELRLKDLFLEEKRERTEVRLCVYARTAYCSADFCLHFLPATVHSIWKQVLPQPAFFFSSGTSQEWLGWCVPRQRSREHHDVVLLRSVSSFAVCVLTC